MRQLIPLSAGAISSVAASFNVPGAADNLSWNTSATNVSGPLVVSGSFTKIYAYSNTTQASGSGYNFAVRSGGTARLTSTSLIGTSSLTGNVINGFVATAPISIDIRSSVIGTPVRSSVQLMLELNTSESNKAAYIGTSGGNGIVSTGASRFNYLLTPAPSVPVDNELARKNIIPMDGTITNFAVRLTASPGSLAAAFFSIYKNGVEQAQSKGSISGNTTSFTASNLAISVLAGDTLTFCQASSIGTPTGGIPTYGIAIVPTKENTFAWVGSSPSIASNFYNTFYGNSVADSNEANRQNINLSPYPIVMNNFFIDTTTAPGGTAQRNYIIRKNGQDTPVVLSVVGTNKTANDTINTIVLAPMDSISIKSSVVAGSPVVPKFGM